MVKYPTIEQVGFYSTIGPSLEMAGGEFCGNATRSLAFYLLKGRSGYLTIRVSGVMQPLEVGVDAGGNAWTQMPIYSDPQRIQATGEYTIVPLQGIKLVIFDIKKPLGLINAKKKAHSILSSLNLLSSESAAGVMFVRRKQNKYSLEPVVWVRDIKTFFYETACGSGSVALALREAKRLRTDVILDITQPSGSDIRCSVSFNDQRFSFASISGKVEILGIVSLTMPGGEI